MFTHGSTLSAILALHHRVVQPGERVEWMQRVQGGKPLDVAQAPAKLQVCLLVDMLT